MRFSPPTLLIIFMFVSFGLVLGAMVLLYRPPPKTSPSTSWSESSARLPGPLGVSAPEDSGAGELRSDQPRGMPALQDTAGRQEAEKELAELELLRSEIQSRLKAQKTVQEQKIAQLAGLCAVLEPGLAAATISALDDTTVHRILSKLDKDAALKIQTVLIRIRKSKG